VGDVALILDDEARRVLVQALNLLQRVAMGQWRAIPEHAPNVLGEAAHQFSACADELLDARCRYTIVDDLVHPSASLGIRQTHREAQVACDIWHALGGGMESRRDDRLTNVRVSVSEVRA
jgi:hypothetical protein